MTTSTNFNELATATPGAGMFGDATPSLFRYLEDDDFNNRLRYGRKFNSQPRRAPTPAPWYRQFERR